MTIKRKLFRLLGCDDLPEGADVLAWDAERAKAVFSASLPSNQSEPRFHVDDSAFLRKDEWDRYDAALRYRK